MFKEIISCLMHIFQSKFLTQIFKNNYIFLNKSWIFYISTDSSSLNISSFLDLLQIIERTNIFAKMYDILGF